MTRRIDRTKAHHSLDAGSIVPATIENDDFSRSGKVGNIALHVHLRLLSLGRGRQRNNSKNARTYPLSDRLDNPTLARAVAPLEQHTNLQTLVHHPQLKLDQFRMQLREFALVVLVAQFVIS